MFSSILEATGFRTYKIYDTEADVWMTLENNFKRFDLLSYSGCNTVRHFQFI